MAKKKEPKQIDYYCCDFETTVWDEKKQKAENKEQDYTEVWAAAIVPVPKTVEELDKLDKSEVDVYNNIFDFIKHLQNLKDGSICFFHNLAFDGSYLISALNRLGYLPATIYATDEHNEVIYDENGEPVIRYAPAFMMADYTYTALITDMGQWHSIKISFEGKVIEIRDSLKLCPLPVKVMGDKKKGFDTKFKKLEIEYEGDMHAFGYITKEQEDYIKNDVLVVAEVLYRLIVEYHFTEMTLASNALKFYKELITEPVFKLWFPNLSEVKLPNGMTADAFCRKGYSGGWCMKNKYVGNKTYLADENYSYLVQDYVKVKNICEIDVNSLYPSKMLSENYPIGLPEYFTGEPKKKDKKDHIVFRRFRCRFKVKKGYLPFIHIKGEPLMYNSHDCLETTDVNGSRYFNKPEIKYVDGKRKKEYHMVDTTREFVMCETEYQLFREHYMVYGYEPIDYLVFEQLDGETMFGPYVHKFAEMKIQAAREGCAAKKQVAKLLLNSLYGKLSSNDNSSWKEVHFVDGIMRFIPHEEHRKSTISISTGAVITAEARKFTITVAQMNYYEGEDRGWVYSDTDSCFFVDYDTDEVKGIKYDKAEFNCWDFEISRGVAGRFCKQKTYIVIATEESFEPVLDKQGNPSYTIITKAAGLNSAAKAVLKQCFEMEPGETKSIEFNGIKDYKICKLYLNDFKPSFSMVNANLKSEQIVGGCLLKKSDFKIS